MHRLIVLQNEKHQLCNQRHCHGFGRKPCILKTHIQFQQRNELMPKRERGMRSPLARFLRIPRSKIATSVKQNSPESEIVHGNRNRSCRRCQDVWVGDHAIPTHSRIRHPSNLCAPVPDNGFCWQRTIILIFDNL